MLIPLWFRRRLVFAPEFFFGRSGCFPIVPFGRGRPDFPAELSCVCVGAVRTGCRCFGSVCSFVSAASGGMCSGRGFTGASVFRIPICTAHRRFALSGFPGRGISCSVNFAISTLRVADAEGVGKIKSEKTHGLFRFRCMDCSQPADFSRIIRESAPSPMVWTDRDGSTRFHKCPACGSSR